MAKADSDFVAACFILALGAFSFRVAALMISPSELAESPGVFPGLMSIILVILGAVLLARSIRRGGGIRLAQAAKSTTTFFSSEDNRSLIPGIVFPAIYVFLAIPSLGFYISSALFMGVMFYLYVQRWRRWVLFPVSIGITVMLYLVFTIFFQVQIW
ncbi:MAG: tripartite tricarboxylate transporter TctB family protein [Candidatus Methylomirabilota bacterium]